MITIKMALGNIVAHKKRAISLFAFTLLITVASLMCINVLFSIEDKMEVSIHNCLTGEVIIRNEETAKNEIYTVNIDEVADQPIVSEATGKLDPILKEKYGDSNYTARIRTNGMISGHKRSESGMIIGINPNYSAYEDSFVLTEGTYLTEDKEDSVILVTALADSLNVKVGDKITVMTGTSAEDVQQKELEVVGIGDPDALSIFALPIMYVNLENAKELARYEDGEYTDFIINSNGSDSKISISDLEDEVKGLNLSESNVSVINGNKVSGYILDYMTIFSFIFIILIAILSCIIGILIINMVVMMGIEKKVDIGTLKAIGFGRRKITMMCFWEMMIVSFVSVVVGMIFSAIVIMNIHITNISGAISNLLGKTFTPVFSMEQSLIVSVVIILILGIFSFVPCWKITKLNPVDAFREG